MNEKQYPVYARRRLLRAFEKGWAKLDRLVDRLATAGPRLAPYNPFYHLGTLAIFLLVLLIVTGAYLTIFYRPGSDRAYISVAEISTSWLGLLMRTAHRYASDALIIVILLHALRTLFSERFWGGRWLAWVSGWVMLVIIWIMGLMGYWLVWDSVAQWLTEYFVAIIKGPFAHSILGTDLSSSSYALFVIVLFLHVFIPLGVLAGILIHVLRLTRSRYWAPRWLMVVSSIVLLLISLLRPIAITLPADLNQLVDAVPLDWLYVGFLPVASRIGSPVLWGVSLLLLGLAMALPWLRPGQHVGPAMVIDNNCTGCSACARECPFEAIDMVQRDDETSFESLAIVRPHKCTGCGICVGACHDNAIELDRLYSAVVRQDLNRALTQASAGGEAPITIYVCDRHAAMGSLPPLSKPQPLSTVGIAIGGSIPLMQAKLPPRVNVGAWPDREQEMHTVITAVIPCTGMLHPNWVGETIEAGGAGAIVVSCPSDDCAYREGPHWVAERLKRRRTLRKGNTHFLELTPGNGEELRRLWALMVGGDRQSVKDENRTTIIGPGGMKAAAAGKPNLLQATRHLGIGMALLVVVFLSSILVNQPATNPLPEQGQIRIIFNHGGRLLAESSDLPPEIADKLPDNVDPAMVFGGERFPVRLRVSIDGEVVLEQNYESRGLRGEGGSFGQEAVWLAPGSYQVQVWMMDDGVDWRSIFFDKVTITENNVLNFLYNESEDTLVRKEE